MANTVTQKEDYMIKGQKIGSGTYGIVYAMTNADGTEKYAFKRNFNTKHDGSFSSVIRELDILNRVKGHPCVVAVMMVSIGNPCNEILSPINDPKLKLQDDVLHFLFELAETDLYTWMSKNNPSFQQLKRFMVDILLGSSFIARSGIVHRDMKAQNIVIFKPGEDRVVEETGVEHGPSPTENTTLYRAKICDFGMATPLVPGGLPPKQVTTIYYRAPEVAAGCHNYDSKVDSWSVGCILYELLFRRTFVGNISDDIVDLQNGIIYNLPYTLSQYELEEIMRYAGGFRQNDKVVTIRDRILGNHSLTRIIQSSGGDTFTTAIQLDAVISKLLIVDPSNRSTCDEVLDLPFFDDYREYIKRHRERYKPALCFEYKYDISNSLERKHVVETCIIPIYNENRAQETRLQWYSHERLIHAIDMFDRCLRYHLRNAKSDAIQTRYKGKAWDANESELYFYSCLYISIKYCTVLERVIDIRALLPEKHRKDEVIEEMRRKELFIIRNIYNYSVYRYTLYEALCARVQNRNRRTFDMLINVGISKLLSNDINGLTPKELAELVIEERGLQIQNGMP
jgi:serine/threonine protein kinase